MFSISNPILNPLLSLLISIIFFLGFFNLGKIIIKFLKIKEIIEEVSDKNFQNFLIGSVFILIIIQPLILLEINILFSVRLAGSLILILGFIQILKFSIPKFKKQNFENLLFYILLLGLFILSMAPMTNADSLDYHLGVPLYILNFLEFPNFKSWIHYSLSGSGELLNTIGLSFHSEQILSMTQFGGILSIVGILKKFNKDNNFFSIIFLSSPVLIFLVSSAKPQLLFVGATSLCFAIVFKTYISKYSSNSDIFKKFGLLTILLFSAISAKFTFALSSLIIFLYFAPILIKQKKFYLIIFICIASYLMIIFPIHFKKYLIYDSNIINLIYPFPSHLFGYSSLYQTITTCGYHGCIPYWIIFPKDLGSYTEALGFGSIIFLFAKNNYSKHHLYFYLLVLIFCLIAFKFGPNQPRWYLEPLIWLIISTSHLGFYSNKINNLFKLLGFFQSFVAIGAIYYGILFLSIGSLTTELRDKVMQKNASGYDLYRWSNSKLNDDDVLITTHRSHALSNIKTIPGDFLNYIDPNSENSKDYFEEIKKLKPNFILFYGDKKNFNNLKKCIGDLKYFKKNVGNRTSRNPLKQSKKFYDGYLYEFKYELLPGCLY